MTAHDVGEVDRETRDALNELGALNRVALLQMNAANVYINGVTSMFPKLKNFFVSFSVVSMLTVAFFLFANFVCGLLSQAFPTLMLTRTEQITREFNIQFGARQLAQAMKWLSIKEPGELEAFFAEVRAHNLTGLSYEDFTHFKVVPWKGRFFNFTEAGFREVRNQAPWPPSPDYFNVFFFGGSTAMGTGPDWATISNYFQEHLEDRLVGRKHVRAYNFGRAFYFSTQERILFQQLLLDGHVPDLAVFIDGLNEFVMDGRPFGWDRYARVFDTSNFERWRTSVMDQARWIPLVRAAAVVADRLSSDTQINLPTYRPVAVPREQLEPIIRRYLENKRQIEAVSKAYNVNPLFVWQPVPGYKYDLQYHAALNPIYGLAGHERSGQGYPIMAQHRHSLGEADFLWLADMQETRKEPLYLDTVHYTADFSRDVAKEIADFVVRRNSKP
jgi:hypothetical protein